MGKQAARHGKGQITASGIGIVGSLPKDFGQLLFPAEFHFLGADKRFVRNVHVVQGILLFDDGLDNGRIHRSQLGGRCIFLFMGSRAASHKAQHRYKHQVEESHKPRHNNPSPL